MFAARRCGRVKVGSVRAASLHREALVMGECLCCIKNSQQGVMAGGSDFMCEW